jgi:hypothetical protein
VAKRRFIDEHRTGYHTPSTLNPSTQRRISVWNASGAEVDAVQGDYATKWRMAGSKNTVWRKIVIKENNTLLPKSRSIVKSLISESVSLYRILP